MAAVTSITVSAVSPKGCTIAFGGGNDFNAAQLVQLRRVVDRLLVEMVTDSTMASVAVVVPTTPPSGSGLADPTGHI